MNYRVIWMPLALRRLAEIWTDASNREAVTAASHRIDMALATEAYAFGEER